MIPANCVHNGHMYEVLLADERTRGRLIEHLAGLGIQAVFHYVPLHSSPAGSRFGRASGDLSVTSNVSDRLLRLPLWPGLAPAEIDRVIDAVHSGLLPSGGTAANPRRAAANA
jgi:dTDP-4-amino-4,6-dideoxygalactose transaminase